MTKIFKDRHYQTLEEAKVHYEIERELANRLRTATKEERAILYNSVYDELYQRLPNNSIVRRKSDPNLSAWVAAQRMQLIEKFLKPDVTFLEVGPGDCSLSLEVAKHVKQVYAVDVSKEFNSDLNCPPNFELVISDGSCIPVAENSIDVVYSHQLMEHLHPDDAIEQLQNIYRSLAPGGVYICITPNRLSGPHDVSKHFNEIASGLHLKEYTVTELYEIFRIVGFLQVSYYKSYQKNHLEIPLLPLTVAMLRGLERCLELLPYRIRQEIASQPLLFRGMTIVGTKY